MAHEHEKELNDLERVEGLMTWHRRDQLETADEAMVKRQQAAGLDLSDELEQEDALVALLDQIGADERSLHEESSEEAWTKFRQRIEPGSIEGARARLRDRSPSRTSTWHRLGRPKTRLGWVAAAQTAVIAGLVFLVLPFQSSDHSGEFRTLSSGTASPASAGNAVIVFAPETNAATISATLAAANARIVDGPLANGGLVIAIGDDDLRSRIDDLRRTDAVLVAEILNQESTP